MLVIRDPPTESFISDTLKLRADCGDPGQEQKSANPAHELALPSGHRWPLLHCLNLIGSEGGLQRRRHICCHDNKGYHTRQSWEFDFKFPLD